MKSLLAFAGRHGPALLFTGPLIGLAWPGLASAMKVFVVGGAACAASALRLMACAAVKRNPMVMVGLSVVGLIVVGIGAMDRVQPILRAHASDVFGWIALAFALNGGLQIVGALLFARTGAPNALSVGQISGNRSVTLIWVAVGLWLDATPRAEAFLAAGVLQVFMLPMLTRPLCRQPATVHRSRRARLLCERLHAGPRR